MSRVLFCWELGSGYGHISKFLNLGLRLRDRGHEVLFALKDLSRTEAVLGRHGFTLVQAPVWLPQPVGVPPPGNYSEILFSFGYFDEPGLTGVVRAWRALFELAAPDTLIMESSPTALLAARGLPQPRALLGTGFSCPPPSTPMPALRWWQPGVRYHFEENERLIVSTMNGALGRVGAPRIGSVAELFTANETFLCTFPELDHYPSRGDGQRYWGPAFDLTQGSPPRWPMGAGKKVFCYLDPGHASFAPLARTLRACGNPVLLHAPGASAQAQRAHESATLAFTPSAASMSQVLDEAELIVCHAGHGTVAAALLAGRALLMAPIHLEQYMLAQRVEQMGAGRAWNGGRHERELAKLLRELLAESRYTAAARAFADRHRDFDQHAQFDAIVQRIEQLAPARAA